MAVEQIQVGHHERVAAAAAQLRRIETDLQHAHAAVASFEVRRHELDGALSEGRIAEQMGRVPDTPVAAVKLFLADLAEDLAGARAKVTGLEHLKAEAVGSLQDARERLRLAQRSWVEAERKTIVARAHEAAGLLQSAQRDAIALHRLITELRLEWVDRRVDEVIPRYLIFVEVKSEFGAGKDTWPVMGDRRVGDDVLAPILARFRAALEGL